MKNYFYTLLILALTVLSLPKAIAQETEETPYMQWVMKANAAGFNFDDSLAIECYRKAFTLGKPDMYSLFGMSFSFANLEQVDSSFLYLEKSIEAGFIHYDRIERNVQYDLLKEQQPERFQKIITQLKQKERDVLIAKGYNADFYYLLDSLCKIDQRVRSTAYNPNMELTDAQRDSIDWVFRQIEAAGVNALQQFIKETGSFPGKSVVGTVGESNAWILVQHADHHIGFQKEYLRLLEEADPKETSLENIAYLTDRILVNQGIPQLYGTQLSVPISDPEKVNERRAKYNMGTLEDYIKNTGGN